MYIRETKPQNDKDIIENIINNGNKKIGLDAFIIEIEALNNLDNKTISILSQDDYFAIQQELIEYKININRGVENLDNRCSADSRNTKGYDFF